MTPETTQLALDRITIDLTLQPRVEGIDPDHVRALEDAADSWPPLIVVQHGARYLLVDGYHRVAAAQNLGLATVPVRVLPAPEDGDLHTLAFALNAAHGRPLSLADRRTEATRLLQAHSEWADREIGRRCGLAQPTIAKLRSDLEESAQIEQTETRVGKGGYTYAVGTNAKQRPPGALPEQGFGDLVGQTVGRLFTSEERRQQRQLTSYFRRLAVALDDGDDLAGWDTAEDAAEACRLVLGDDDAASLGHRLGSPSRNVLNVAVALGYDDEDAA